MLGQVDIDMHSVKVEVRGELKIERTFWEDASEADKDNYPGVITPEQCLWSLDDEVDDDGEDIKLLMITLVKRPVTDEEREWKKSKRMDNQDKKRIDRRNAKVRGSAHANAHICNALLVLVGAGPPTPANITHRLQG